MASSGNVEVVLEPAAVVEQPPVEGSCDDGESGLAATAASTEESQPMMLQEQEDMAPEADDHREAVAPDAEASVPEEEPDEQQEPAPVADSKEGVVEPEVTAMDDQESSRERLKRHRREMAGRVWVPEMWGQETLLKDWVDCAVFDRPLVPPGLLTARRALIAESCARRPDRTSPASSAGSSQRLRVRNGC
ncbi:hypothetical protein U9M48_032456 [Paspalum notatum var. saurae]|uniref:Uncharacterized protein n=1 Tax=Paspalum notatum var. saurae TaxID=547442 RepID=A0AAQ3U7B7_PASNO